MQAGFAPPVNAIDAAGEPEAFTVMVMLLDAVLLFVEPSVNVIFGRIEPVVPVDWVQADAPHVPSV